MLLQKKTDASIAQSLERILTKGLFVSDCKLCCLACIDGSAYSFSSFEKWALIGEATDFQQCCINIYAAVETFMQFMQIKNVVTIIII